MKILIDTHCWLWLQVSPERINPDVMARFKDQANELYLSAASSWEIAIKYRLGKLQLPVAPSEYVPDRMRANGVKGLPVEHAHALYVSELPPLHRDPFDRLLVAQGILESMTIATVDPQIVQYEVETIASG